MTVKTKKKPPAKAARRAKAKPAKKPEPPKAQPIGHDEAVEFAGKISRQESRCQESSTAYLRAKEETKKLKEAYEGDVTTLRSMIRQFHTPLPLFSANGHAAQPGPTAAPAPDVQPDDGWKVLSIVQLGLTPAIVNILAEAELTTLGELCDFQATHGDWWHKKLKGIGKEKRGAIEDAQLKFWSENKQFCRAKVSEVAAAIGNMPAQEPAPAPESPPAEEASAATPDEDE